MPFTPEIQLREKKAKEIECVCPNSVFRVGRGGIMFVPSSPSLTYIPN